MQSSNGIARRAAAIATARRGFAGKEVKFGTEGHASQRFGEKRSQEKKRSELEQEECGTQSKVSVRTRCPLRPLRARSHVVCTSRERACDVLRDARASGWRLVRLEAPMPVGFKPNVKYGSV